MAFEQRVGALEQHATAPRSDLSLATLLPVTVTYHPTTADSTPAAPAVEHSSLTT